VIWNLDTKKAAQTWAANSPRLVRLVLLW